MAKKLGYGGVANTNGARDFSGKTAVVVVAPTPDFFVADDQEAFVIADDLPIFYVLADDATFLVPPGVDTFKVDPGYDRAMSLGPAIKDPQAVRQYTMDWSDLLGTKTISAATWTVGAGLTKESESNTTTTASVIVSGGAVNREYDLLCHITFGSTSPAEEDERTLKLTIKQL